MWDFGKVVCSCWMYCMVCKVDCFGITNLMIIKVVVCCMLHVNFDWGHFFVNLHIDHNVRLFIIVVQAIVVVLVIIVGLVAFVIGLVELVGLARIFELIDIH